MSYILDALKKLETEKERKARGAGMVNIAGELFKNGPAPPKAHRNWPLILGLVLLASLLTFGATFMFLHGGKGKKHADSSAAHGAGGFNLIAACPSLSPSRDQAACGGRSPAMPRRSRHRRREPARRHPPPGSPRLSGR